MIKRPKIAVCVGRFQPLHVGHMKLMERCLLEADHVAVLIGSAHRAATPRNPFSWETREHLLRESLTIEQLERVSFVPLRDYFDVNRWSDELATNIDALIDRLFDGDAEVIVSGAFEQQRVRRYVRLQDWKYLDLPRVSNVSSSDIRDSIYAQAGREVDASNANFRWLTEADLAQVLTPSTFSFLANWRLSAEYKYLADEWFKLYQYKQSWRAAPFSPVFVTADCVVQCAGHVLLVQRAKAPGKGLWALPGGFIESHESIYHSALRELIEETSMDVREQELTQAYKSSFVCDHPNRSERGRVITHVFRFDLGERALPNVQAADDASDAAWFKTSCLKELEEKFHDDHFAILDRVFEILSR